MSDCQECDRRGCTRQAIRTIMGTYWICPQCYDELVTAGKARLKWLPKSADMRTFITQFVETSQPGDHLRSDEEQDILEWKFAKVLSMKIGSL